MNALFTLLLLPLTAMAGFPAGKCSQRSCVASPYALTWITTTSPMCFTVSSKPCADSDPRSDCCTTFARLTEKFVLPSPPECRRTVKRVTLNGVARGGGVYFDLFDNDTRGEFRITNLKMSGASILDSTFCIFADPPCDDVSRFCKDTNGNCRYSTYDVARHVCCPTCYFVNSTERAQSPPPPSPPPPSTEPGPPVHVPLGPTFPYYPYPPPDVISPKTFACITQSYPMPCTCKCDESIFMLPGTETSCKCNC